YYGPPQVPATSAEPARPYAPTVIQNSANPARSDLATTPVTRPGEGGATVQPLYARPGATPGQFELYTRPPPAPGQFEAFVAQALGRPLPRFGASLILSGGRGFATGPTTTVPPDYRLNPGDELLIGVTGSVEADLRLVIDAEGRIFVPRIGPITVAGLRYGDLSDALSRRFAEQFRKARVSVIIGRLHGLTVYVTGYAVSPGAYTVSSLSTLVDAVLAAGGPSAAGSFRSIQLRRGGQPVADLDLYDLLLRGDKTRDAVLQNEDVLYVAPAGPEVAVSGAVNSEAIYEAKAGETLGDVIRFAGGFNSLADESRLIVSRLADLDRAGSQQLDFAVAKRFPAERGDIVRVLSLAGVARPLERQAILATIEGEVDHAGRYYLAPGSTLADLLAKAGGLTSGAYVFGTELDRVSVKAQQQASFDKAIGDLELSAAALPLSTPGGTAEKAASATARSQAALAVVDRLKQHKPDGRLVLSLEPEARALPGSLALEDHDRIIVPPRPKTVGVFGAVYQPGSFLFGPATRLGAYLRLAGGPRKIADKGDVFVVRANGAVLSSQQDRGLRDRPALPGDVIFVPVRTSRGTFEKLLDVATLVYQFGIGALAIKAIGG
ncbi:MAG: SLBB domain-containing protein, partial [Caulobacteraceae bacterium]|nr:SLBB domain-containing protein [Caulobacteraceae bacterium]